jgi:anti-sigma factor RsiW
MPMNCDQAIEFLPWLLNGTLEATERDEVRRHLATCERCRAALNDTREAWTIFGQHIPSDALVGLANGEIPAGVDPAVAERHLATCAECAAELELARTSRRLEEDDRIAVFPGARSRQEKRSEGSSRTWRAAALAAGLAGLVAGAGWIYEFQQAGSLAEQLAQKPAAVQETRPAAATPPAAVQTDDASRRQMAEMTRTVQESQKTLTEIGSRLEQANRQIADLQKQPRGRVEPQIIASTLSMDESLDVVRGETKAIRVPKNQGVTLRLGSRAEDEIPRSIEILGAGRQLAWSGTGLNRDQGRGEYQILLPAGSLEPGSYTIQLYAAENGKRVPRESYKIRVE